MNGSRRAAQPHVNSHHGLPDPCPAPARMNLPPRILASASPRREALLRQLGFDFRILASQAPEVHHQQLTAQEISQINAYRKARSVAKQCPDALVLGADTLVYLDR